MAYKGGSGQTVGIRLLLLQDYFNSHASKDKVASYADIMKNRKGFFVDTICSGNPLEG